MQQPAKSVFNAAKERKDIERDAQLLANRIALLKQEEFKTWKKIEETKKRASEVTKLKINNEQKAHTKMAKMQQEHHINQAARDKIMR